MGFYGNITNVNNTTFAFDRVYPNRVAMDQNSEIDGIFIGRYVLIEYDNDQNTFFNEAFIEGESFFFSLDKAKKTEILYEDKSISKEYYVTKGTVIYTKENGKYTYYKCTGKKESDAAEFSEIILKDETDPYFVNYTIDKDAHAQLGRGYDSTVWQKTYVDNSAKYVMIAELNSVVPTFDLTIDSPTMVPSPPHFDADSTNIYYKMHVQPNWGFKVAHANPGKKIPSKDNEFASESIVRPSDEKAIYKTDTYDKNLGYNEFMEPSKYDAAIYYNKAGFDKNIRSKVEINEEFKDSIMIEPTGYSGQKYNAHSKITPNKKEYKKDIQELSIMLPSIGNTINDIWDLAYGEWEYVLNEDGSIATDVYGKKLTTFKNERNLNIDWGNTNGLRLVKRAKDNNGFEFDPRQSQTIAGCINSVNDLMGMIITNSLIPEEVFIKQENEEIEDYKKRVNSEIEKALNLAVTNRIYYGNYDINNPLYKGYYIKYPDDKFILFEETFDANGNSNYTMLPEDFAPINLTPFEKQTYYYIDDNNYYLEQTTKPSDGVEYYSKDDIENIFETKKLAGEIDEETGKNISFTEYKPNIFYHLDDKYNYIYATEPKPIDSLNYYIIGEEELIAVTTGGVKEGELPNINQTVLFNPFNHYKTSDDSIVIEEDQTWTGYFIKGDFNEATNEYSYTPVYKNSEFIEEAEYYLAKDYRKETKESTEGIVFTYYDFATVDKDGEIINPEGKLTQVKFVKFTPTFIDKDNKIVNLGENKYYIKKEDSETGLVEYELFVLPEEELNKGDSYNIPSDVVYYMITQNFVATPDQPFYWPGLYYYKETWGDYIKAEESSPAHDEYFIIDTTVKINPVDNIFYRPGKFFYQNETGYYVLDYSENMRDIDYYEAPFYYVKEDPTGMFPIGSIWNTSIKDIPRDEDGKSLVILATKVEGWKWKELIGFARDFNTIHGLIIEINKILKTGDDKTRDLATIQGCINSINDIIVKIGTLKPTQIAAIDKYGRIAGSDYTTAQDVRARRASYDYKEDKLKYEVTKEFIEPATGWLDLKVDISDVTPEIQIGHKFNPIKAVPIETDMNTVSGDKICITRPVVDDMGHVVANDTETIQLPNGFKTILAGGSEAIAENSKDLFEVTTDEWFQTKAFMNENGNPSVHFNHEYPKKVPDATSSSNLNESGDIIVDTITLETIGVDDKGHVTHKEIETITLPYGYKTFKDALDNNANKSSAKNTQDEFAIIGDSWIKPEVSDDQVQINHIGPVAGDMTTTNNVTPQFGGTFTITDYHFDEHGHKFGTTEHTVTIPQGSLSDNSSNGSDVITQLVFDASAGALNTARTNISELKLNGYVGPEEGGVIESGNTLADALELLEKKDILLQSAISTLNGDSSTPGSVAYQIAQVVAGADAAFDTLKEIADWINDHPNTVADINSQIQNLRNHVNNIETSTLIKMQNNIAINANKANDNANKLLTIIQDINNIKTDVNINIPNEIRRSINNALYINGNEKYAIAANVNSKFASLDQDILTVNSRCNVLDKEVKNLINAVPAEKIAKWDAAVSTEVYEAKIAELIQENVTLHSRCNVLDKEVKQLIYRVDELEAKLTPPEGE